MPTGEGKSNPRSIQIFWDDLTSSKMELPVKYKKWMLKIVNTSEYNKTTDWLGW